MPIRKPIIKYIAIAAAVFALTVCGAVYLLFFHSNAEQPLEAAYMPPATTATPSPTPQLTPEPTPTPEPEPVVISVHVTGYVNSPGLVRLPEGSLVYDAINAAGGFNYYADDRSVNLAAELVNGQQIIVNSIPTPISPPPPPATPLPVGQTESISVLININTSSSTELQRLRGVGPVTAQNIINYRERHGPFLSIEQIKNVSGIGPATFENLRDHITVD